MKAVITRGHSATEPGLRAHSVDEETFPWRIVGGYYKDHKGQLRDLWKVQGADGVDVQTFREIVGAASEIIVSGSTACDLAHDAARCFKRLYPEGYVVPGRNIGGALDEIPGRLAGCLVRVTNAPGLAGSIEVVRLDDDQVLPRQLRGTNVTNGRRVSFPVHTLATSPHIGVAILELPQ